MLNIKSHALYFVFVASASMTAAHHELRDRNLIAGSNNYQEYCASCHGVKLEGQPNWREYKVDGSLPAPPHDETGHTWHHDTRMLFEYTKFGGQATLEAVGVTGYPSGMPAYEGILSDQEIWEILSYIRSTWPQEIQDAHATRHPMSLYD